MQTPAGQTIHLKPENVLEIAKNMLKPAGWKCEWIISSSSHSQAACSIVLGSWNAYLKVDWSLFFPSFFYESLAWERVTLSKMPKKKPYLSQNFCPFNWNISTSIFFNMLNINGARWVIYIPIALISTDGLDRTIYLSSTPMQPADERGKHIIWPPEGPHRKFSHVTGSPLLPPSRCVPNFVIYIAHC